MSLSAFVTYPSASKERFEAGIESVETEEVMDMTIRKQRSDRLRVRLKGDIVIEDGERILGREGGDA